MKNSVQRGIAVSTLAVLAATSFGPALMPVQAQTQRKSFVRRHPFITGAAVVGGAMMYRHHQKKMRKRQMRQQQRMMRSR